MSGEIQAVLVGVGYIILFLVLTAGLTLLAMWLDKRSQR